MSLKKMGKSTANLVSDERHLVIGERKLDSSNLIVTSKYTPLNFVPVSVHPSSIYKCIRVNIYTYIYMYIYIYIYVYIYIYYLYTSMFIFMCMHVIFKSV